MNSSTMTRVLPEVFLRRNHGLYINGPWTSSDSTAKLRGKAGTVWVMGHVMIAPNMPFGGAKQSGMGRDFGIDWLDAYAEVKSVCIRH